VLAPFNASLMRAVAAHQRGEQTLGFSAAFSSLTKDLMTVIVTGLLLSWLTICLLMCCYVPALLVPLMLSFVGALVALHGLGVKSAFKTAFTHAKNHLGWHALYMLAHIGISIVANNIPVIGPAFMIALHVRAQRALFGDGENPVFGE
jgi:hypothetical protein